MKNKYVKRSRISEIRIREVIRCFTSSPAALQAAVLSGAGRNAANRPTASLGNMSCLAAKSGALFGILRVGQSFFGTRPAGRRGRGPCGKTGIFERRPQVHAEIVPDCSKPMLQGVVRGRTGPSTVVNSDGWRGHDGLIGVGRGHFQADHSRGGFAKGAVHVDGIGRSLGLATVRPTRFMSPPGHALHLHLKGTERRHNHRHAEKRQTRCDTPRKTLAAKHEQKHIIYDQDSLQINAPCNFIYANQNRLHNFKFLGPIK